MLEAETNRALIKTGGRLVVTADHTKWGVTGISTIASLGEADVVITDDALDSQARKLFSEQVGRLVLAGGDEPRSAIDAATVDASLVAGA